MPTTVKFSSCVYEEFVDHNVRGLLFWTLKHFCDSCMVRSLWYSYESRKLITYLFFTCYSSVCMSLSFSLVNLAFFVDLRSFLSTGGASWVRTLNKMTGICFTERNSNSNARHSSEHRHNGRMEVRADTIKNVRTRCTDHDHNWSVNWISSGTLNYWRSGCWSGTKNRDPEIPAKKLRIAPQDPPT